MEFKIQIYFVLNGLFNGEDAPITHPHEKDGWYYLPINVGDEEGVGPYMSVQEAKDAGRDFFNAAKNNIELIFVRD